MLRSLIAILALVVVLPAADAVRLTPGSTHLRPGRIRPTTDTTQISVTMNGQVRTGPMQIESLRRIARDGRSLIEHRIVVQGGRASLDDTTWYEAESLRPVAHRSHGGGRSFSLDYGPAAIRGVLEDSSGSHPIEVPLPEPVFDPSALHPIIRSLSLRVGASFLVPFFNHESRSIRLDTLSVEGEDRIETDGATIPVWRLLVAVAGRRATYYVAKDDGRELRVVVAIPGGEMRAERRGVK